MNSIKTMVAASLAATLVAVTPVVAQQITFGKPDATLAAAGTYKLDEAHAGVVARVSHVGYSFSIFRFDTVKGSLTWDPAKPSASSLSVSVAPGSIKTNVPKFAEDLAGPKFLNSPAFPEATFVSKAFEQTDATHGKVTGDFTLMGKTKSVTFDVVLVGAGPGFGAPRIGVEANTWINPQDFGLPDGFSTPIQIVVDVEFVKAG